jgi:ATP sulfurylase
MNPYVVISAAGSMDLEDQVNDRITQGYGVYGPCVSFMQGTEFEELVQPMMLMSAPALIEIQEKVRH